MASNKKKKSKDKKEKKLKKKSNSSKKVVKDSSPSVKKTKKSEKNVKSVSVPAVLETFQNLIEIMEPIAKKPMHFHDQNIFQSELEALKTIEQTQPITLNDLSDQLKISKSAVLKTINKLQIKGLVEKAKAPHGQRQVAVSLTDKGAEATTLIPNYETQRNRPITDALEKMTAKELALFNGSLERILMNFA